MTYPDLSSLIKSYDIRGIVGETLTAEVATAIGAAFADAIVIPDGDNQVVIGHDMRDSGPALTDAVIEGIVARGIDVVRIGLCSTDGLYHASGALDLPGVMVTASHNPAAYNGMKLCRSKARAVGNDNGLSDVRELASRYLVDGFASAETPGTVQDRDTLADYGAFLRLLVPLGEIRPLKVVVDAANAMAGHTVPAVLGTGAGLPELPLEIIPLYFELDGTFPNHEPNPLETENLRDLQAAVLAHGADLGLAFDGDADRCFVVDEKGQVVSPSAITCMVGLREAERERSAGRIPTIIYNLISSRAVPEQLTAARARVVRARVGHSYIKAQMAQLDAVFGGEHSAHFYFRDFWFADSGMLAAMHVLAALGTQEAPLSELLSSHDPYAASGEINSTVADLVAAAARVKERFITDDVVWDDFDGLTVAHWDGQEEQWWFNVRPSNTEPHLRLNVEAARPEIMERIRDEVLAVIREG